jgi:hypothetical protein
MSPIHKEGKARASVDSYRPIYLISAMCKLFSLLLTSRITHHIETNKLLGEEHMGFRRKGCEETAATLWELLSIRKRQGSSTFVGFLDGEGVWQGRMTPAVHSPFAGIKTSRRRKNVESVGNVGNG